VIYALSEQDRNLLDSMEVLMPLERLGKILYNSNNHEILQPIHSREELGRVLDLMRSYTIDWSETGLMGEAVDMDMFFAPEMKEQDTIQYTFDIAVGLHPRYLGNAPHSHDFFELTYVCRGSMTQTIADLDLELSEGDLIILCPDTPHDILSLMDSNVMLTIRIRKTTFYKTFLGLFREGDVFYTYFHSILDNNQSTPFLYFKTGEDAEILRICMQMYRESNHVRDYSQAYLNLLMSELFLRLLRDHCDKLTVGPAKNNMDAVPIALILQYIHANCREVSLSDLAERFHYNASYLSRLLKEKLGKSFVEIRAEIRMNKARDLLKTTNLSAAQIAEHVGYTDISRFYKHFKSQFHMPPSEYKAAML